MAIRKAKPVKPYDTAATSVVYVEVPTASIQKLEAPTASTQ
jgi:hypothetical protein